MPRKIDSKMKQTTGVDKHVGNRLRLRRTMLGMSQTEVAHAVGLTFQQVQKYERGSNRIGAGRLFEFASVLEVPVTYFFDGLSRERGRPAESQRSDALWFRRETLELARAYANIRDPAKRALLLKLVRSLAGDE
jgi:transcriptional regulator with XRE-family HTH domain